MNDSILKRSIGMPRGGLLRIEDGAGLLVYVLEGELWITEDGGSKDHVVRIGQKFRVRRGGATLATAFRRSVIGLVAAGGECPARRITLAPHGSDAPRLLHRRARMSVGEGLRRLRDAVFAPLFDTG